eukprot:5645165-Prymnesium_polylepis.1
MDGRRGPDRAADGGAGGHAGVVGGGGEAQGAHRQAVPRAVAQPPRRRGQEGAVVARRGADAARAAAALRQPLVGHRQIHHGAHRQRHKKPLEQRAAQGHQHLAPAAARRPAAVGLPRR